jgi:RNA polymerase sigma-70 factor (ECF subfamily)
MSSWNASDEALLAGFGTGEATAGAVFVRRFQRRVYGLALSILGDEEEAADVAQEAFVRAWRHAATFDPRRGSVVTWMLTITRNLSLDHLRARRSRPVGTVDLASVVVPTEERPPEDRAVIGDEARQAFAAMRSLPEPQRRAVALATYAGRTAREIGEIEGIPVGTAKTRIRTALARLRADLDVGVRGPTT